ncbi:MAG: hypothetical protein WAU00_05230, partial [Caldilinea sp.]
MNRLQVDVSRTASRLVRYLLVFAVLLAMMPASAALAQEGGEVEPAAPLPPSLVEELANAPGLAPAVVPADVELPEGLTAEELAQMPDRSQ